jgi:hypothetical protein
MSEENGISSAAENDPGDNEDNGGYDDIPATEQENVPDSDNLPE